VKRLVIVGFDPGTTAALAIIDTRGDILFLESKRGFKRSGMIDEITRRGKPLIVAGDRSPLPKSVEKLASTLGCKAYHPIKSLSNTEKLELVKGRKEKVRDDHEKDALASALKAFHAYSKLFKRTETALSSLGMSDLYEKVIEMVMSRKAENINEAINKILTESKKKPEFKKKKVEEVVSKDKVKELQERIKGLEKDIVILKKYNEGLKKKLREKKEKRPKIPKKIDLALVGRLRNNIKRLNKELSEKESLIELLKTHRKLGMEGYIPLIELREMKSESAKDLDERLDLENRVLFVKNPDNAQILNDYKIKVLISENEPSESTLEKVNFPIINEKDISIEKIKNISVVKKEEFEEKFKTARKSGFIQWIKGHKKRKL